jgi:hypothetical protein
MSDYAHAIMARTIRVSADTIIPTKGSGQLSIGDVTKLVASGKQEYYAVIHPDGTIGTHWYSNRVAAYQSALRFYRNVIAYPNYP